MENTYFITGFPGFIAGRLIRRLLEMQERSRFILLIHPGQQDRAVRQIEELLELYLDRRESIQLVTGDITKEDLGIADHQRLEWKHSITHLFHLAAVYDLAVPYDIAYEVNVTGTRRVNEWARQLPQLQRYVYFSTAYVSGERQGVILETELAMNQSFKNHYESTKYEAEVLVQAEREFLPLTIIRPGIVMGDSRTGETAKFDGPYFIMQFLHRFRHLPIPHIGRTRATINLVPVDYVVEATIYLAHSPSGVNKVYHLTDPDPKPIRHVYEKICGELLQKQPSWTIPISLVSAALSIPAFRRWVMVEKETLDYFQCESQYDCRQALADLKDSGIACPSFDSYVGHAVRYFSEHRADPNKVINVR
jgi:thioester reductase-like protein